MARYPRKKKLTREQAAARLFQLYSEHLNWQFEIGEVCRRTSMTVNQVRNGERHLKAFLNEHKDEMPDWTLHVALSSLSAHGLINEADDSLTDAVSRKRYMSSRAASELDYLEQKITRVTDEVTRRKLRRGITFERAAAEAYAEAYERMAQS